MKNSIYIIVAIIGMMITTSCGTSKTIVGEEATLKGAKVEVIKLPDGTRLVYVDGVLQTDAQAQQILNQQAQQQMQGQVNGTYTGANGSVSVGGTYNSGGQQQGSNGQYGQQQYTPSYSNIYVGMTLYSVSPITSDEFKSDGYGNPVSTSALKSKTNSYLYGKWVDQFGVEVRLLAGNSFVPFQAWMEGSGTTAALNSKNAPMQWQVIAVDGGGRVRLSPV